MKGRKIKNLTKEDITIVDYKKILVKNSQFSSHAVWLQPPVLTRGPCRLLRPREGETVQQVYGQDEDVSAYIRRLVAAPELCVPSTVGDPIIVATCMHTYHRIICLRSISPPASRALELFSSRSLVPVTVRARAHISRCIALFTHVSRLSYFSYDACLVTRIRIGP